MIPDEALPSIAALVHLLPDAVALKDEAGRWQTVNRGWRLLLGIELGQVQGRTDGELIELLPGRADYFRSCQMHEQEAWLRRQAIRAEARVAVGTGQLDLELTFVPLLGGAGQRAGLLCMARDITYRVRTAEALCASERRFRDIFQMNAIPIWEEDFSAASAEIERLRNAGVTDIRRYFAEHPEFVARCAGLVRVLDVNAASLRLYGARSKQELLGAIDKLFTRETLECFGNALLAITEGRREYCCETVNRTLRGELVHILMMVTVPDYGDFRLVLVSMIDITARKRMEQELKRSQAQLADAQRIAHLGSWERDLVTGETRWSDEVFHLFGFEPSEFIPSFERFMDLVHPADRERVEAALAHAFAGEPYSVEYRICRDEGFAVLHEYARVVRDAAGAPLRLIGTVQDITQRKHSEALSARLGRIIDRSSNEIFVVDAATVHFLQVNFGAGRKLGYSPEEFKRMTPLHIMPALTLEGLHAQIELLKGGAESLVFETEFRRKDGSTYPAEARLHYYPAEEPPVYVAITQDITERKAVDRMKAEFLATVSHELRTPLTALHGSLSLLAGGVGRERWDELVDIGLKNSDRLLLLINDLLDLQTLESGNMEFRFAEHDLMALVDQAAAINAGYGAMYGVQFHIADRLQGARVRVDASRLIQVLTNLLSNAAKFSPDGSEVEISVRRMGDGARVTVTDSGAGIPEQFAPRLFTKFAQADGSNTRRRGGTGLGLSVSKEIIEALGGRIGFENRPAGGASFHFDLPLLL